MSFKKKKIIAVRNIILKVSFVSFIVMSFFSFSYALAPQEVVIIVNKNAPGGMELAQHYMKARSVPDQNVITLETSFQEVISREDFEKNIAAPVKEFILKNDPEFKRFKCLLIMYGLPLRVEPPKPSEAELAEVKKAVNELNEVSARAENLKDPQPEELAKIRQQIPSLKKRIAVLLKSSYGASLDSELALVREVKYRLEGWVLNKMFAGFKDKNMTNMPQSPMLVSRLDGPNKVIVARIINDSLEAEKNGLRGKAYFDARWPYSEEKSRDYYRIYDRSIHKTAKMVQESGRMDALLDKEEKVFAPDSAPDAALYCGWYSLGNYVDAFKWSKGAVGYHIASSECVTLKSSNNNGWCRMMLLHGAAATIGPVAEPYVNAFPYPELFFGIILDGRVSLAEAYALSVPYWSWQMVLIGDPLYMPFKNVGGKKYGD
ncbi:MAG: TIGR03790 family protein [Nitrospirae bacterium]|nr:TIGR03790 family protein [Nitrospirota bacterium]